MGYYTTEEKSAMDRDARNMGNAGVPLSGELEEVRNQLSLGNLGITAAAGDVDSLAKGGGAFTWDLDNSSGLIFAVKSGRMMKGKVMLEAAAATVTLAPSTTNYVEVDGGGTVSTNTVGFTTGRLPLYTVVTGSSAVSTTISKKPLLTLIPPSGVDGSMLSTPGATKQSHKTIGTIATSAGSTKFCVIVPTTIAAGSKLTKVRLVSAQGLATSDTNYVAIGVVNKGASGSGTQVLADVTAAANTTKATGGSAFTSYVGRDLTLATLTVGTERDVTGGDVLELTFTVTGTLANTLTQVDALLEFGFTN